MSRLLTHSTKKNPEETIAEIQQMLLDFGVTNMFTEYDGRQVKSVSFGIELDGHKLSFRMPCNWRGVYEIINTPDYRPEFRNEEQAARVAWRIIKVWIEGQLAMVEVNMVTIPEVFLPYAVMKDGRTLAEQVISDPKFLLE